ncbi:MAG TPA: nuclear transport factor 2 family protein [Kofleriaceae bacterium]|nr:nuclear transport factor 2 family protein [Kofleriaceae bacterium]
MLTTTTTTMTMTNSATALAVLIAVAACGSAAAPTESRAPVAACGAPAGGNEQITKAVLDMYAALRTDDLAGFRAVTEPSFYAFEGGERMDGDALVDAIKNAHAQGKRFEWTVTQPVVVVDCTIAHVTYVNVGAIGDASSMQPRSWVESALLRYRGDRWRIQFFHSTRVPAK